jgi:hypothetical protein
MNLGPHLSQETTPTPISNLSFDLDADAVHPDQSVKRFSGTINLGHKQGLQGQFVSTAIDRKDNLSVFE